ncbi:MAG: S24 family peptidase [Syntrophobacteraceae bacterium]
MKQVREMAAEARGVDRLSQARFAKMIGVHPSVISHIEAGTTRIQPEMAGIIDREIGIRQAWLLTGEGPVRREKGTAFSEKVPARLPVEPPELTRVKTVRPVLDGATGMLIEEEQGEDGFIFRTEWLARKGCAPFMRIARISGDSMSPTLVDGDFVLFDTSRKEPLDGKIMAVGIDDLLYIKRLRLSPEGFFLVSDNGAVCGPWRIHPDSARFLGLVVWRCGAL